MDTEASAGAQAFMLLLYVTSIAFTFLRFLKFDAAKVRIFFA